MFGLMAGSRLARELEGLLHPSIVLETGINQQIAELANLLQQELINAPPMVVESQASVDSPRYQAIFNHTYQFTGLLTPDGILLEANQTALDFGGLTRADVIGRPLWEVRWWQGNAETQHRLQKAIKAAAAGEFVRYEVDVLGAKDAIATIDFSLKPVWDDDGKVVLIIPEGRDITQRKLTESALRESEARMKALLDNAQSVIYMKDREGRYLLINRRYEELFHIQAQTTIGKTDYDIFPPAITTEFQANDRTVLLNNTPIEIEEVAWQEGEPHTYISTKFPVYDDTGSVYAVCGISTDITQRKQTEEALRESEAKFRQLAENLDDVVWIADANHQTLYVSPVYEKIWGRSCEDLYRDSSQWLQAIYPEDRPQVEQALQATLPHGSYDAEYRIIRPDGEMRWIRDRGFLIKNEAGVVYRIAGIAEDINDRKLAEAILYQRQQEFVALVENSPDVIARFDRQLRHSYINCAIEKEIGIPPQAFISKTVREVGFPAEFVNIFEPALQQVLATGQEQTIELSAQTPNGRSFSQMRLIPETAPDGTISSILALGRDITAIRAAQIANGNRWSESN